MKIYLYYIISFLLIISSCQQKKRYTAPQNNIIKPQVTVVKEDDAKAEEIRRQREIDYMDTVAIGNIHLNTTRDVFEKEKQIFLSEVQKLAAFKIKTVKGFFYEGRLAALQIISYPQDAHKTGRLDGLTNLPGESIRYWTTLYYNKYSKYNTRYGEMRIIELNKANSPFSIPYNKYSDHIEYVKGRKGINVTDLSATDRPCNSFEELVDQPFTFCYNETILPEVQIVDKRDVFSLFQRALSVLSPNRADYYRNLWRSSHALGTDIASTIHSVNEEYRIYNEAKDEANRIIQHNRDIHRNDDSYSVIKIIFMPAYDKYKEHKREIENKQKESEQNDLDRI